MPPSFQSIEPSKDYEYILSLNLPVLAQKLSQEHWDADCSIPVLWNGRLSKALGRFLFKTKKKTHTPIRIELSKKAAQFLSREAFVAVLLHELCHYHLCRLGKPFHDHHPIFESEVQRVGAIATNQLMLPQKVFRLTCSTCNNTLGNRKRINIKHYRSTCCGAPIVKQEVWIEPESTDSSDKG